MRMCCSILATMAFALCDGVWGQDPHGDIHEISAAWESRMQNMPRFVCRADVHTVRRRKALPGQSLRGPETVEYRWKIAWFVDLTNRKLRRELDTFSVGMDGQLVPRQEVLYFDGEKLLLHTPRRGVNVDDGNRRVEVVDYQEWADPLLMFSKDELPLYLSVGILSPREHFVPRLQHASRAMLDQLSGYEVTVVDARTRQLDQQFDTPPRVVRRSLTIDLDRDAAITRDVSSASSDSREIRTIFDIEYQETSCGWVPSSWKLTELSQGEPQKTASFIATEWSFPPLFPNDLFKANREEFYYPGAIVSIPDKPLLQVDSAGTSLGPLQNGDSTSRGWSIATLLLLLGNGLVLAFISCWLCFRRRRQILRGRKM